MKLTPVGLGEVPSTVPVAKVGALPWPLGVTDIQRLGLSVCSGSLYPYPHPCPPPQAPTGRWD